MAHQCSGGKKEERQTPHVHKLHHLNKACPKDSFPLPHINSLVSSTARHEMMSITNAYLGYNQIFMHPDDHEKTTFIRGRRIYCFKVMSFRLKNAVAIYQRLDNKMFTNFIDDTMGVYIDDMIVKSLREKDYIEHLQQAFEVLRKYIMKLNPTKCSFGVTNGKFLG